MAQLDTLLSLADQIYVNGDIHCFADFPKRKLAFDYLQEKGYL